MVADIEWSEAMYILKLESNEQVIILPSVTMDKLMVKLAHYQYKLYTNNTYSSMRLAIL